MTTARVEPPRPREWLASLPSPPSARPVSTGSGALESNECMLAPSDAALVAMTQAISGLNRYPDGSNLALRSAIGRHHGVPVEAVAVGNGSEELLQLLLAAYAGRGGTVALADPACTVHERACALAQARVVRERLAHWRHDLDAMAGLEADIAVVCNPHNPSGTAVDRAAVAAFLSTRRAALVVVDEAYVEFADDPEATTSVPLAQGRADLAVLRTFSKIYGLAGARVGYLVADPQVVSTVRRLQLPFAVNAVAQAGALAALADTEHVRRVWTQTRLMRDRLTDLIRRAGFTVVSSQSNFVLVLARDEEMFAEPLAQAGVTVRRGKALGIPGTARVTVPDERGLHMIAEVLGVEPSESR